MIKRILIIVLMPFIISSSFAQQKDKKNLLRDGFVLKGADGKLTARGTQWFFELEKGISDGKGMVKAGTKLEMLTSAGLEKMIEDMNEHPGASYRLFNAVVTRYKDKNLIFAEYFLLLSEAPVNDTQPKTDRQERQVRINEPNDVVVIPDEIIAKLQSRRIIRPEKLRGKFELKQDSILANRTGFIQKRSNGKHEFVFDALGRNMPRVSLELLNCGILERTERKQARDPQRRRFRVSGVVTKFKGKYYLLLQQAIPSYGYGNFGT